MSLLQSLTATSSSGSGSTLSPELLRNTLEASLKSLHSTGELFRQSEERLESHEISTKEKFAVLEQRIRLLEESMETARLDQGAVRKVKSNGHPIQTQQDSEGNQQDAYISRRKHFVKDYDGKVNGFSTVINPQSEVVDEDGSILFNNAPDQSSPSASTSTSHTASVHSSSPDNSLSLTVSPRSSTKKVNLKIVARAVSSPSEAMASNSHLISNGFRHSPDLAFPSSSYTKTTAQTPPPPTPSVGLNGFGQPQSSSTLIDRDDFGDYTDALARSANQRAQSRELLARKEMGPFREDRASQTDAMELRAPRPTLPTRIIVTEESLRDREENLRALESMLDERNEVLEAKETALDTQIERLKMFEKELLQRQQVNEQTKAIHDDHELELEKRLHAVQRREVNMDLHEGVLTLKAKGQTAWEREAADYRRQQDLRAMQKDLMRRGDELNKAEQDWCEKRNLPFVPVV